LHFIANGIDLDLDRIFRCDDRRSIRVYAPSGNANHITESFL